MKTFTDDELIYAATARCPCGAGMAYWRGCGPYGKDACWDCSAILKGEAIPFGQPGAVKHEDRLPFVFWNVKSEQQPSADGMTTRPSGVAPPRVSPPPQPSYAELEAEVVRLRAELEKVNS
jgi:hypothetical protein